MDDMDPEDLALFLAIYLELEAADRENEKARNDAVVHAMRNGHPLGESRAQDVRPGYVDGDGIFF
jgi:hypothetical protein